MAENYNGWRGFAGSKWKENIDVRDFIQENYTPYDGDSVFLRGPTQKTEILTQKLDALLREESRRGGVLDINTDVVSSPLNYPAGYLDRDNEVIVGTQTDAPLRRGVNPFGGIRMARSACEAYGYKLGRDIEDSFRYRTTHNEGVFRVYTEEIKQLRHNGLITGLPDAYGRGRIIGDYRRVALYGVDRLIEEKTKDKERVGEGCFDADSTKLSEELFSQIDFLRRLTEMAKLYGIDISKPAENAREAFQWLYFAYLAAIKEQNGAAMSLGRTSTFLDIYVERDLREGTLDEDGAQEIVDHFVLKLRQARHLRTPEYNELFAGDPMWITESLGGVGEDGRHMVTKNSYRFLRTLYNLKPSAEPNLTVLWSQSLPESFKAYAARVSVDTDSIQYESDDLMRPIYGDDYGIACCVSAMKIGKQMQFFGARCNLPKLLLLSLNGGRNEKDGTPLAPLSEPVGSGVLDYDDVVARFDRYLPWLCREYVKAMNIIHYMHDKYAYEKVQMALHDTDVHRFMAFGISGISVVADSLSAIKYAKVTPVFGENGVIESFRTEGEFPTFGNGDRRVDSIARELTDKFIKALRKTPAYRGAEHTLSLLTITSNVMYGKKTGATPDGRPAGAPFAPGANPMHGREKKGALAAMRSIAALPYSNCRDGISYTFSITPPALGANDAERTENLVTLLDGYFRQGTHHINVNVLDKQKLIDAMNDPELYPNLTVRISGYAVNFNKLSRAHKEEIISRTFYDRM